VSFRRHVITGETVLFAPGRAGRPHAFTDDSSEVGRCPFCPGHESDTPAEIGRIRGAGATASWLARVFPNKYPPIEGAEVIVEAPEHDARFEDIDHADTVVRLYIDRYRRHADSACTVMFKNQGVAAGSSIEHVHSQLVPLPFVPVRIAREIAAFENGCPLCARLENVIRETESFYWIAPSSSWMPYQQWIVPKRHVSEMSAFDDRELAELAELLRASSAATRSAFNWIFMNFARAPKAHAYVEILPRMTTVAGFELGTGTFVEIIDPARAAEALRR
jgi:UDPglucose--hexose-1-phosphate uridylyltransferase